MKSVPPRAFGIDRRRPGDFVPYRPSLLAVSDQLVKLGDRLFGGVLQMDANKLIDKARRKTGLEDFGDDAFREPLDLICELSNTGLSAFGRLFMRSSCVNNLTNKLKINAEIASHPEILTEEIRRPIFILGLPRTGSTFLHRLLAQDPSSRVLMAWEASEPVPPPERETLEHDPRIRKANAKYTISNYVMPALKAIHETGATLPEECIELMANELVSFTYYTYFQEYGEWYHRQDLTMSYRSHKRQLQLLQWKHRRDRWLLKSPAHLFGLASLLAVYPDARIIQTHRDPADVIPSCASLVAIIRAALFNVIDPEDIGPVTAEKMNLGLRRGLEARLTEERRPDSRALFHDVHYPDLIDDPMAVVRKIYERFDLELSESTLQRFTQYATNNMQHRYGKHPYSIERFGLNIPGIQTQFDWYYDHFRVPRQYASACTSMAAFEAQSEPHKQPDGGDNHR